MPRPYQNQEQDSFNIPGLEPAPKFVDYKGGIRPFHNPYFSGSQAKLWIGDIWLDEVVDIAFNENEAKVPVYGYASRYYDTIARGRSLVNGAFTINYKFNGWLNLILDRLFSRGYDPREVEENYIDEWISRRLETISVLEQNDEEENAISFAVDLINQLSKTAPTERTKTFENSVKALRKRIWGVTDASDISHLSDYRNFDISITFGIPPETASNNRLAPYGSFTAERIIGVSLVGKGKRISVDGQPIFEEYQFIAQSTI